MRIRLKNLVLRLHKISQKVLHIKAVSSIIKKKICSVFYCEIFDIMVSGVKRELSVTGLKTPEIIKVAV